MTKPRVRNVPNNIWVRPAELDFNSRVADHKRLYGQREVPPWPIAQQMQEAAKLAEADRGQTAPKRNVPAKGDR